MKRISAMFLALSLSLSFVPTYSHAQVVSSWAKPSLERLQDKKIIPVILRDKDLRQSITRGEFTHLLMTYYLSNKNYDITKAPQKFKDTSGDKFINTAYELGIVTGYTDGTFKPNVFVTRSEAAVIANNVEQLLGNLRSGSVKGFKDYKFIPKWAVSGVGAMVDGQIMSGYKDGNFIPSRNISRQEAIVMVDKLAREKESRFLPLYEISKDDEYLKKTQYDFILSNLPSNKYSSENIKQYVFDTEKNKRISIYEHFTKSDPISKNEIFSSPDLVFETDKSSYILGIEKRTTAEGKKEQRTFISYVSVDAATIKVEFPKDFSSWVPVDR